MVIACADGARLARPANRTRRLPRYRGLMVATFATLFLVPIFYTLMRQKLPALHTLDQRFAAESAGHDRRFASWLNRSMEVRRNFMCSV